MKENTYLQQTLEQIGLTAKEAEVYLALLSLESTTAYRIAEHCQVKKPTVYVILEDLRKKGLVLKVPHAKKALFAPKDIAEYLQEEKEKLKQAEAIVPKLRALGGQPRSSVFFFEGLAGIRQAMDHKFETMRGKTFHSFYGNLAGCDEKIFKLYGAWERRAVASGISFNIIMAKAGSGQFYQETIELSRKTKNITIQFLEQYQFPPNQSIEVGEDFVRIVNEKELHATIIDDASTATAMRQIFNIVWQKDPGTSPGF